MAVNSYLSGGHLSAKYTMTLKTVLDMGFDIGLKNYPIYDENYRETLNQKICDHFMLNEIGLETAPLFVHRLNVVMNEIMPLYNQYYESEALEFDALTNFKSTETLDRGVGENTVRNDHTVGEDDTTTHAENNTDTATKQNDTATTDETHNGLQIQNDTPETNVTRVDINTGAYATQVNQDDRIDHTDGSAESNSVGNSKSQDDAKGKFETERNLDQKIDKNTDEKYTKVITGYRGIAPQQLINQLYDSFVNVDLMILNDAKLNALFMGVF